MIKEWETGKQICGTNYLKGTHVENNLLKIKTFLLKHNVWCCVSFKCTAMWLRYTHTHTHTHTYIYIEAYIYIGFPSCSDGKESAFNAGDSGSVPELGRSPVEGNAYPFPYNCQENSMDRGAWRATDRGLQTVGHDWVTNIHSHTHTHSFFQILFQNIKYKIMSVIPWAIQ